MNQIDINCDMGEIPAAILDGTQESLMPFLTSVNIACGGHAGDEDSMRMTVEQALRWRLAIGAHPGYPDRANFGRVDMSLSPVEVETTVYEQVVALARVAAHQGANLVHVKAHGQLYNQAVNSAAQAQAIARGVARLSKELILVGLAGSTMLDVFRDEGFSVAAEAFVDRLYEPDGTLRSRKFSDALIRDPEKAAEQAVQIVEKGTVISSTGEVVRLAAQTICIHGDEPDAPRTSAAVAQKLREAGITPQPLVRS